MSVQRYMRCLATQSLCVLVAHVYMGSAVCIAEDMPLALPSGIGPLPDFRKGAKTGVFVTREHIDKYRAILPREVSELIAQNEFACEAALNPQRPELFERAAPKEASSPKASNDGSLSPIPVKVGVPIFSVNSEDATESERRRRAYEVLWNTHSVLWAMRSSAYALRLTIFKDPKATGKQAEFAVQRVYPQSLGVKPGHLEPLFREKISAISPQVLSPLTWLTLRFLGDVDDYVWVSSPIISKTRQLTGSNRADPIFTGAFSPDDLFVWSGKVELVEPKEITRVPMLVPVLEVPMGATPVRNGPCEKIDFTSGQLILNEQSGRFRNGASWIPSNVRFVVRTVWRIEVTSKDPFSLDAYQVVYVDALTHQAVYRSVWGHDGRLRRFVIGVLGSVVVGGSYQPAWAGQILLSSIDGGRSVLTPTSLEICDEFVPGRALKDFDPAAISPQGGDDESHQRDAAAQEHQEHLSGE